MARHYVPSVARPLISALYHEAKRRHIPMTRLLDTLIREAICGTPGWQKAQQDYPELAQQTSQTGSALNS